MEVFFFINNVILVLATLGNLLALQGVILGEFVFRGYRRFLTSLLVSDLYVVAINLALFSVQAVTELSPGSYSLMQCPRLILQRLAITGFMANLLNFCAMSIDHFVGLVCPLNYRHLMKPSTITTAVIAIWLFSIISGFADIPVTVAMRHLSSTPNDSFDDDFNFDYDFFENDDTNTSSPESSNNSESLPSSLTLMDQLFQPVWCDGYFDPDFNRMMQCFAFALAVSSLTFLSITCGFILRETVLGQDIAKRKLRKLVLTTLLLLCAFCFCWLPYVCYEVSLVFTQEDDEFMPESNLDYFVHNVLYSIFVSSQFIVPIVYIARNRIVQRHLVKKYEFLMPNWFIKSCCCLSAQREVSRKRAFERRKERLTSENLDTPVVTTLPVTGVVAAESEETEASTGPIDVRHNNLTSDEDDDGDERESKQLMSEDDDNELKRAPIAVQEIVSSWPNLILQS